MMPKQIGEKAFTTSFNELHSFDAYYKNVMLINNNLIIPYINLGISNHEINQSQKLFYLNFAYIIFEKVSFLTVYINRKRLFIINKSKTKEVYDFGGTYLDFEKGVFNDMQICSEKAYLQTLNVSELSENMWIPIDTPNNPINMDQTTIEQFFDHALLPITLKSLLL